MRPFISMDTAIRGVYNALILPHFYYCSPVWYCLSGYLSEKLQKLKKIVQPLPELLLVNSSFDTSSNLLLWKLKWDKLSRLHHKKKKKTEKQKAVIMNKTMNELAPDYLQRLVTRCCAADYNLRSLEGKLSLPKPSTIYMKRSFCYSGARLICGITCPKT